MAPLASLFMPTRWPSGETANSANFFWPSTLSEPAIM